MCRMKLTKTMLIGIGIVGGGAVLVTCGYLVWNSRQMKMMRTVKRISKIVNKTGEALQSVADIV